MNSCYVGRGSLLVSVMGTSGGFFTLSGESEITLDFQEDNESIFDARNGVIERTDWYVRNYRATLNAACFRIEPEAIALLLKAVRTDIGGDVSPVVLADPVAIGRDYFLRPNITGGGVTVSDAVAALVPSGRYAVDLDYGLIRFNDVSAPAPYTISFSSTGFVQMALNGTQQIFVSALFKGFDKASNRRFMAEFYRLAIDISEQFALVQKEFSALPVRMQAIPDLSQPLDAQLGQYGRIMLL